MVLPASRALVGADHKMSVIASPVEAPPGVPDGKYLIYSQMREGANLMLVENFH